MSATATNSVKLERGLRRFAGGPGALGYAVVVVVVGVALLLYFLDAHNNAANGGAIASRPLGAVVGDVTGIAAAVLLAVTVILAGRFSVLELLFGDLTKVYVAHGVIGLTMFALVSFHPMTYFLGALLLGEDLLAASHVLVPFHVVVLEWISYILIVIAMVPTMYMRLPFDKWRWIHLLLGLAMILTGYDILIEDAVLDTSQLPALRDYLFVVFGLATAAFIWVALVRRLVEPKREYRIVGVEEHPEANAVELLAEPVGRPVRFEAGQFIYADLLDSAAQIDREFEAHPFSIASPPGQSPLSLVIETTGRHTARFKRIGAGDEARALLHGPYGRLVIDRPARKRQLWLAGGIGITPYLAMAGELANHPERYEGYEITLIVGVDHAYQAFEVERLERCADRFPGLDVHLWSREEQGLPTAAGVAELIDGELAERAVMISGPEPMIAALTEQLEAAGVPRGQIRSELPIGPPGNWRIASPALRWARTAVTAFFGIFVVAAVVATVARALFA